MILDDVNSQEAEGTVHVNKNALHPKRDHLQNRCTRRGLAGYAKINWENIFLELSTDPKGYNRPTSLRSTLIFGKFPNTPAATRQAGCMWAHR